MNLYAVDVISDRGMENSYYIAAMSPNDAEKVALECNPPECWIFGRPSLIPPGQLLRFAGEDMEGGEAEMTAAEWVGSSAEPGVVASLWED